jgi:integrase
MQMCIGWQRAADMARQRLLTEDRAREVISEILVNAYGSDGLRSFTTRQWFDHWCKIKSDSQDAKTASKYEQVKREFLDFLGHKADQNLVAITSRDVRAFRDHKKAAGVSATTLNFTLTILSAYFNAAWKDHVISNNPCSAVEHVKDSLSPAKRQKQPFTVEQVKALLDHAKGDWRGLIRVAYYSGARLENCANLRFKNLDFNSEPSLIVFEKYSKHGDEHKVPMHPALEKFLLSLSSSEDENAFVFPSLAGPHVANLSRQFRQLMDEAHIKNWTVREGVRTGSKSSPRDVWALGFHSLRRTNVSLLANAGVSEEMRMAVTAHATREVHKGYTHHELARLRDAVAQLPAV